MKAETMAVDKLRAYIDSLPYCPDNACISLKEVVDSTGMSEDTVKYLITKNLFPQPTKIISRLGYAVRLCSTTRGKPRIFWTLRSIRQWLHNESKTSDVCR